MSETAVRTQESNGHKLTLVVTCLSLAGGAEVQAIEMALGLRARGWQVEIVSMLPPQPPAPDFTGTGISVRCLDMRRGVPDLSAILRFRDLLRESRPDVVHSHMTHANLLARATRPFTKIPVLINTLHGYKMYSVKNGGGAMRELAHRVTDRFADMTTVVCSAAAQRYAQIKAVPAKKLMMIPNGIRTSLYRRDETVRARERRNLNLRDEFVWLAAGRLEMVKDYDTMLRAFAMALEADQQQVLLIAGQGSLQDALKQTAEDLCITENVRFLGFRDDISTLMSVADGFVMSSVFEGMPLVLLEAGASELPVVATRVGGNAETIDEGASGLLVPDRNPRELGQAMLRIASMTVSDRRAMGKAGADFVRAQYSLDIVLDRWEALYFQLLEQNCGWLAKAAV